jgi:NADPH2:quinone reductase
MTDGSAQQNVRWTGRDPELASENVTTDVLTMRALLLDGPSESLQLQPETVARPRPADGEVVVEVHAAGVNRSDLLNVRGLPVTTFPRILGRDFAGVVVEGPEGLLGREVWGSGGGDLGFTRNGSHAHYLALPADGLVEKPDCLTHLEAAACGLAYYTAAVAVLVLGRVTTGERVLVLGAAGGVGSAATAIARWKGATVFGVVKDAAEVELVRDRDLAATIDSSVVDVADAAREASGGDGFDLVIDTVGPALFSSAMSSLGMDGRMVVMTAPLSAPVMVDLGTLYRMRQQLLGLSTIRGDVVSAARLLRTLLPGFESGALTAPPIAACLPIELAGEAFAAVADGASGRVLLVNEAGASP